MKIFTNIKNSIYNKEYYRSSVMTETFGQSIKYLVKLCLVIAIVGALIFTIVVPFFGGKIKSEINSAVDSYPADLTITINNGEASINQPVPYIYKMPTEANTADNKSNYENLVVIDTNQSFSMDKYKEYKTYVLLTKSEIVYPENNKDGLKIMALSTFGNVVINQDWLRTKVEVIMKYLPVLLPVLFIFIFIGLFLINFIGELIILLLYALITWLILHLKGIKTSYQRAYQVSIHAVTLILILFLVSFAVSSFDNFFVKILVLAIVIIVNFDKPTEVDEIKDVVGDPVIGEETKTL